MGGFFKRPLISKILKGALSGASSGFLGTSQGQEIKSDIVRDELQQQKYMIVSVFFGVIILLGGLYMALKKRRK